ncbi:MAG TPA: lysylphosphatidylglycerol synthase transmembrane domain-containing protein [bacterium]|nr:lysylphosphatidylglycerol synthase transmembrane domain-containing protein [bacterium]
MTMSRAAALRVLRIVIAVGILVLLFRSIPWSDVRNALRQTRPAPAIAAFGCGLLMQLLVGLRWREIMAHHGLPLPRLEALRIHFGALFYSAFLPAGNVAALVVRVLRIEDRSRNWTTILHSLLIDRLWATGVLTTWGIIGLILSHDDPGFAAFAIFGGATFACASALLIVSGYPGWKPALFYSLTSHALGVTAFTLLGSSIGLHVGFGTFGWIRTATILATMLPVTVMGIGVRESVLVYLLSPRGVESPSAVALSILVMAATVLGPALFGGLVELERLIQRKAK